MPNNITRSRTPQSLAALIATTMMTMNASAEEIRSEPDTAAQISSLVYALVDPRQSMHIYGTSPDRPSQAEAVLAGRPFKTDCVVFAKTARDLLTRAGIKARVVRVQLPPTAPCSLLFEGGRLVSSYGHMIAAFRDQKGREMALDIRQPRPVPLGQLMMNSRQSFTVDQGGR